MTRAGVFLTAALVAASFGSFAQDRSAASPSAAPSSSAAQANTQPTPSNSGTQPGVTEGPTGSNSAPNGSPGSSHPATTAASNRAIEGTASNVNEPATANGQLPQTSTILPLLGLIGLGSLVAGLFARR